MEVSPTGISPRRWWIAHRISGGSPGVGSGWCSERVADAITLAAMLDKVLMAILEYA